MNRFKCYFCNREWAPNEIHIAQGGHRRCPGCGARFYETDDPERFETGETIAEMKARRR